MKPKIFAGILAIIILLLAIFSCNTSKLDSKRLAKIEQRHPEKIAAICVKDYPCTTTKSDTIYDYKDSVIIVDCPDTAIVHDSLVEYVGVKKYIKVPIPVKLSERVIIKTVEDSAKIYLFYQTINDMDKELKDAQIRINKQSDVIGSQRIIISHKTKSQWLWFIVAMGMIGWKVFSIYNRFKQPSLK